MSTSTRERLRLRTGALVLLVVASCGGAAAPWSPPLEKEPSGSAGSMVEPFLMTKAEAGAAGFVPVGFSFDVSHTKMKAVRMPMPGWLVAAYGPPDESLTLLITSLRPFDAPAERERALRDRMSTYAPLSVRGWSHAVFAGAGRDALELESGQGETQASWCAIFVERHAALLVVIYGMRGSKRCDAIASAPAFASITTSFVLR
jgi:hypothetical protein